MLKGWRDDLAWTEGLPASDPREILLRKLIAKYEDAGHGACWLRDPRIAALVERALLHFDGQRYRLIAWCVMPNHVHALVETREEWPLASVVHSWKSFTAHRANLILKRSGDFWLREYFDRFIRDDRHFASAVRYIENNPVKAGLVARAEDWRWSSALWRGQGEKGVRVPVWGFPGSAGVSPALSWKGRRSADLSGQAGETPALPGKIAPAMRRTASPMLYSSRAPHYSGLQLLLRRIV